MKGWIIFSDGKRRIKFSGTMRSSFIDANKNRELFGLKQMRNKTRIYELIIRWLQTTNLMKL